MKVKTDEKGRMSIPELRKAIETTLSEGKVPFMIGATAGTHKHSFLNLNNRHLMKVN